MSKDLKIVFEVQDKHGNAVTEKQQIVMVFDDAMIQEFTKHGQHDGLITMPQEGTDEERLAIFEVIRKASEPIREILEATGITIATAIRGPVCKLLKEVSGNVEP